MTRLGDDLITDEKRQCVLQARQEADGIYKVSQSAVDFINSIKMCVTDRN